MLLWMIRGRVAGTSSWGFLPQGGTPAVLLLPPAPFYRRNNLFPRATNSSCTHSRMEARLQGGRRSRELEFGGSVSIPALDAAQSPGHLQVFCNCLPSKH